MRVGIVILAAGASTRMGSPKQLLPYRGRPLICHAVEQALAADAEMVFVVLGANAGPISSAISRDRTDLFILNNPRWREGMGASIQVGVEAATAANLDAVIITLGDQPHVSPQILNTLIATQMQTGKPIVAASYAGVAGVPAL